MSLHCFVILKNEAVRAIYLLLIIYRGIDSKKRSNASRFMLILIRPLLDQPRPQGLLGGQQAECNFECREDPGDKVAFRLGARPQCRDQEEVLSHRARVRARV